MHKSYRYSGTVKPFINVRGLNLYPAPDYLMSEIQLFKEDDLVEGMVVEFRNEGEEEFTLLYPGDGVIPVPEEKELELPHVVTAEEEIAAPGVKGNLPEGTVITEPEIDEEPPVEVSQEPPTVEPEAPAPAVEPEAPVVPEVKEKKAKK